ncbi:unnamed protein product [Urochloa decumbens]|uniref:Uncharacterized protein n=1 Tax=Urochloa decumbens TaxID=240449 RepID=A0ABC9A994_9POAL
MARCILMSKSSDTMLRSELQEEEFQEADILWPDDAAEVSESAPVYYACVGTGNNGGEHYSGEPRFPMKLQLRQIASSPIDIPGRKKAGDAPAGAKGAEAPGGRFSDFGASLAGSGASAGSVVVGSHVFVPPHVIVDRRAKRDKAVMMLMVPSGRARARKMREQF